MAIRRSERYVKGVDFDEVYGYTATLAAIFTKVNSFDFFIASPDEWSPSKMI